MSFVLSLTSLEAYAAFTVVNSNNDLTPISFLAIILLVPVFTVDRDNVSAVCSPTHLLIEYEWMSFQMCSFALDLSFEEARWLSQQEQCNTATQSAAALGTTSSRPLTEDKKSFLAGDKVWV